MPNNEPEQDVKETFNPNVTRRDFMKVTAGAVACASLSPMLYGCGSSSTPVAGYPIDSSVVKTTDRMISFPYVAPSAPAPAGSMPDPANPALSPNGGTALTWDKLNHISQYDSLGYGKWDYVNEPLPIVPRTDLMPAGYVAASAVKKKDLVNFVAWTDVHLTDKEAPNQLIYLQESNPGYAGPNSSIYSGVMLYTPHVFDAAVQTVNALHKQSPIDFVISLGDVCNTTMYNELRWYIDIVDGKVITPSSGAHLGAASIDYQKPFKAAGLHPSIPLYQALGNHDHFMIGSFPVYESGLEQSYLSDKVWAVPNELLSPRLATFPALFDKNNIKNSGKPLFYQGVIDGATALGNIKFSGSVGDYSTPPSVVADPDRRSLPRAEWIQEFFNTTSGPVGHGFNLVTSNPNFHLVPANERAGFACYSFVPKSAIPLKVIVLDDTQREDDGSIDIHGHGFLDATRWTWLQAELDAGQAANQLMVIAAHIPIGVANIGSELEWWLGADGDASTSMSNATDLTGLINKLQNCPNLLMWIAGHRHVNHVKAFKSPDPVNAPEKGFWQVESSSLRDFPQQFRSFDIYLNSDYSVSIEAVNVDPAVASGTPAARSRKYAIATQQILHTPLTANVVNYQTINGTPLVAMDPSRPQGGEQLLGTGPTDPSIQYLDLTSQGIPYNASYNARLFKQLSPAMKASLQALFPLT
jgi:metallophosphoesterase (TIGR03768 family)